MSAQPADDGIEQPTPGSRRNDLWTSKDAEMLFRTNRNTGRLKMLRAFYAAGDNGLTADEAAHQTDMLRACYWKRVSEIRQLGLIALNKRSRMGDRGGMQVVSVITDRGRLIIDRRRAEGRE